MTTDNVTLEDLNTLTIALLDAIVNFNIVTYIEFCNIRFDLLLFDCADDIHGFPYPSYIVNTCMYLCGVF